jgi:hypothetical protein
MCVQVLHDRNGELFPYGFTYLKVKMEKMITKLSRKEPALLAADAAARIAELLPTIKAAEQKKQEVMDALAVSRAASSQPPVFGAGGAGLAVKQGRVTRVKARKVALRAHKEPKEYWRLSLA